ncbi:MAG: Eco29kI family restriction endonuclease [Nitrospiraceae bacterium]|nr:Eco29kI family restriction endonuclease [Nitrospiraceae bacterium]
MTTTPYNPLDKINLAQSIERELLERAAEPLYETDQIAGAGIYVIYYSGPFEAYGRIRASVGDPGPGRPIYVGKAIPKGGRKGGLGKDAGLGTALRDRLRQHAGSVDEAVNLELTDFFVRHLIVDDIWIPLGENMLIERFKPLWNRAIDGFGNKDPGKRRATQYRSPWDVLHPGRVFAEKLGEGGLTIDFLRKRVDDYLSGRPLDKLPKVIEQQIDAETLLAEEAADEASI